MSQLLRELDFGVARVKRRWLDNRVVVGGLVLAHHGLACAYRVPETKCPVKTGQTLLGDAGKRADDSGRCKFLTVRRQLGSALATIAICPCTVVGHLTPGC